MAKIRLAPTKKKGTLTLEGITVEHDGKDFYVNGKKGHHIQGRTILPENLICALYRDLGLPTWSAVAQLTILYKDGNPTNLKPSNLIPARYPEQVPFCEYRDGVAYQRIPGVPDLAISKAGRCIRLSDDHAIKWQPGRYFTGVCLVEDKRYNFTRNRLMALAYVDYPANADELVVDHLNNKSRDDRPDNLDWKKHVDNVRKGYRVDNNNDWGVEAKCILTGEITRAENLTDLACWLPWMYTDNKRALFTERLKAGKFPAVKPHHLVRVVTEGEEPAPWPEVCPREAQKYLGEYKLSYNGKSCYVKDLDTASYILEVAPNTLRDARTGPMSMSGVEIAPEIPHYEIQRTYYHESTMEFPSLSTGTYPGKGVVARYYSTGEEVTYPNARKVCLALNVSAKHVREVLGRGHPTAGGIFLYKAGENFEPRMPSGRELIRASYIVCYKDGKAISYSTGAQRYLPLFREEYVRSTFLSKIDKIGKSVTVGDYTFKRELAPIYIT